MRRSRSRLHPWLHPLYALLVGALIACGGADGDGQPVGSDGDPGDAAEVGPVDITGALLTTRSSDCADYEDDYVATARDLNRGLDFTGQLGVQVTEDACLFISNAIPNHDFNDGGRTFVNAVRTQSLSYRVPRQPVASATLTPLSLEMDNAVFLNGVKLDLLAAGCFGVGDGKIGCFDMASPFRYDPMSPLTDFGTDSHNAHTQPDGTYHYHGNPRALFADDAAAPSPVIGFAADGFPIYGPWIDDGGSLRKARSSYRLKPGSRSAVDGVDPGGSYDGSFVDDYEYVDGAGDLDACNGMTVDGANGYYVTDTYPWVLGCFRGTPDPSFSKRG